MQPTVTIDNAELNAQISDFIAGTGRAASRVVKDQAKLFLRDLVAATPPFGKHTFSRAEESWTAQRRIGEKAVRRDILKVFRLVGSAALGRFLQRGSKDTKLEQRIQRYARSGRISALKKLIKDFLGSSYDISLQVDPAIHDRARNSRTGRVRAGMVPHHFVLRERSLNAYIREKVSHVGRGKAGWASAAVGLGVHLPNWITRHSTNGLFSDDTNNETAPSVTLGNLADYASDWPSGPFEAAIQNRIRSMQTQLAHIIEYEARKRGAR